MNDPIFLRHDGAVATLTLSRPESMNALDSAMMDSLVAHTASLAKDESVRCIVIAGAGKHFMAGGDLREFADHLALPVLERERYFAQLVDHIHTAIENIGRMPHPVIAQVHGAVAGFGLSLMCACDLAIAADSAYFTSAYRNIGLTPDGGATYSLPRIVGTRKAMEIVLLGERFDAQEALRLGLVNRVVSEHELEATVRSWAAKLASGAVLAARNGKRLIQASAERSLTEQLRAEASSFGRCAASADFAEGLQSFFDKRPPVFRGES
jgi:2-(1,2-epoxy-1,2-dihydrophenyl)acetyl-CoA isomerase